MNDSNTQFDFDTIAQRYDRCNHLFSFGIDHRWRREVIEALKPQMHQRLLDVCTGTGDLVFAFCKHSPLKSVAGLDISQPMLALAQEKQIRLCAKPWLRGKQIRWHWADAAQTELPSDGYDFITCGFGMRNISDRSAVLGEMHRVLKPGGKLCVLEFSLPANPVLRGVYQLYLSRLMPATGRLVFGSKEPLDYLARSICHWHTEVNFSRELAGSGFSLIRKTPLTGGIVTLWLAKSC